MSRATLPIRVVATVALIAMAMALLASKARAVTAAPSVVAPGSFSLGFADPWFSAEETGPRDWVLAKSVRLGARFARVGAGWRGIELSPPADRGDPSDPSFAWRGLDDPVRAAAAQGLEVIITVHGAPAWAEGPGRPPVSDEAPAGTWKPDPKAYGEFLTALGRRYSGNFPDPADPGRTLPRVAVFEAWNEPNLRTFMSPQWVGGRSVSGDHMRRMINAAYRGLKSVRPDALLIGPGTSPFGDAPRGRSTRPLRFLHEMLCLHARPLRAQSCPRPVQLDALSQHPISPSTSPRASAAHPAEISIADIPKLQRTLRAAERAGTILPPGSRDVWVTEFWWETRPPDDRPWVPTEAQQARWISLGLYDLWRFGVPVAILFQVIDEPAVRAVDRRPWESGLLHVDGTPKPSLRAVRFPFVAERRLGRRLVSVWGIPPRSGLLKVTRGKGERRRVIERVRVQRGEPFKRVLEVRGRPLISARLARLESTAARVAKRRSRRVGAARGPGPRQANARADRPKP